MNADFNMDSRETGLVGVAAPRSTNGQYACFCDNLRRRLFLLKLAPKLPIFPIIREAHLAMHIR